MAVAQMATLTPGVSQQDHCQGPENAPVTLVEYGDYECPYCGEAYPIVKQVQQQAGNQLRFCFRNFPLPQHPYAMQAAEAAEAAGAQGKFWEMHDMLYQHQNALDFQDLLRYARQIGLNMNEFEQALRDHKYLPKIRADVESGLRSGVQGTPSFFINGRMYEGPTSDQALLSAIQNAEPAAQKR